MDSRVRRVLAAMSVVAMVLGVVTWQLHLRPSEDQWARADALLVFDGGRGERVLAAYRLAETGRVDHVVLLDDADPDATGVRRCEGWPTAVELHCLDRVGVSDTRSEAASFARYARAQSWDTVVVVTSTYHLTRSRLHTQRCFDGEVLGVRANPDGSPAHWFGRILHEWGGLVRAVVQRGC